MNKLWYSWETMRQNVNDLCREISLSRFYPDVIVGISRGGLIPGVMISHYFKTPFKPIVASLRDFPFWEDYFPEPTEKNIIIVDDICDSGETFSRISEHLKMKKFYDLDVRYISLWWNNECDFEPHFFANEIAKDSTNTWIHFPWDHHWKNIC